MHGHVSTSSYELVSAPWVNKLQLQKNLSSNDHPFCVKLNFRVVQAPVAQDLDSFKAYTPNKLLSSE